MVACRSGTWTLVFDDVEAHLVGGTEGDTTFDAAAGHPHREGLRMVVAAQAATERDAGLDHRRAAKLTAPDDERAVEQAALFEIFDERGAGLIGAFAVVASRCLPRCCGRPSPRCRC